MKKTKAKKVQKKVGRPKTEINLNELEKLSRLNCTMPEIAFYFNIPLRTLEDKFTNDNEVRESILKGRATGMLSLRRKQIQIMEETNSTPMAIWLGEPSESRENEALPQIVHQRSMANN